MNDALSLIPVALLRLSHPANTGAILPIVPLLFNYCMKKANYILTKGDFRGVLKHNLSDPSNEKSDTIHVKEAKQSRDGRNSDIGKGGRDVGDDKLNSYKEGRKGEADQDSSEETEDDDDKVPVSTMLGKRSRERRNEEASQPKTKKRKHGFVDQNSADDNGSNGPLLNDTIDPDLLISPDDILRVTCHAFISKKSWPPRLYVRILQTITSIPSWNYEYASRFIIKACATLSTFMVQCPQESQSTTYRGLPHTSGSTRATPAHPEALGVAAKALLSCASEIKINGFFRMTSTHLSPFYSEEHKNSGMTSARMERIGGASSTTTNNNVTKSTQADFRQPNKDFGDGQFNDDDGDYDDDIQSSISLTLLQTKAAMNRRAALALDPAIIARLPIAGASVSTSSLDSGTPSGRGGGDGGGSRTNSAPSRKDVHGMRVSLILAAMIAIIDVSESQRDIWRSCVRASITNAINTITTTMRHNMPTLSSNTTNPIHPSATLCPCPDVSILTTVSSYDIDCLFHPALTIPPSTTSYPHSSSISPVLSSSSSSFSTSSVTPEVYTWVSVPSPSTMYLIPSTSESPTIPPTLSRPALPLLASSFDTLSSHYCAITVSMSALLYNLRLLSRQLPLLPLLLMRAIESRLRPFSFTSLAFLLTSLSIPTIANDIRDLITKVCTII